MKLVIILKIKKHFITYTYIEIKKLSTGFKHLLITFIFISLLC
jgi:hypothetical protein